MGNLNALGGLLPLVNQTLRGLNTVERAIDRFGGDRGRNEQALRQLQERNRLEEELAAVRTAREQAIVTTENQENSRRREAALRRAVSRQRAMSGAAGVEDEDRGGSGQAVLLGLYNEDAQEQATAQNLYALRQQILTDNLASLRRRNLLAESQLSARRR
jgi:hypothetical protein